MSDRRADQGTPLFPRRTLSGPSEGSTDEDDQRAQESGRGRTGRRGREARRRDARGAGDDGPPTAAMSRVDTEQQPVARHPSPPSAYAPVPAPPSGRQQRPRQQRAAQPQGSDEPRRAAAPGGRQRPRQPRKARLRIVRLDPWSVMKMAFALSIALAIVTVIAVAIVWSVLDAAGVWESINTSVETIVGPDESNEFEVQEFVGLGRVMGLTTIIAVANIVLLTALATLAAFLYNLAAALLGGFEVTLAEDR